MSGQSRVVIAGGGTAGHVYPGLALARALTESGHEVEFIGTKRGLERTLVPAAGFVLHEIEAKPFERKLSMAAIRAPLVTMAAVRRCRKLIQRADAVVGVGGYASASAVLAARRERIPIVLHEQNAVPGLANRVLSHVSSAVALSFADASRFFPRRRRLVVTGNPVRNEILQVPVNRDPLRREALQALDLDPERRTIVVFGGSQGALHIDQAAVGACRILGGRADLQVVLITGPAHLEGIRGALSQRPGDLRVRLFGYMERMDLTYACADLVVARAGATTIAELSVCGLPALLIPYPYATRQHQEANARSFQRAGGASLMLDDQLSAESLAARIEGMVDEADRLETMADRSAAFGRPDAAERLADLVVGIADRGA